MATIEETHKLAKNTRFAILTREAADAALTGQDVEHVLAELDAVRLHELQSSQRLTEFAAIGRQLGDAHRAGRDTSDLLRAAVSLRRLELHGQPGASIDPTLTLTRR